MNSPLHFSRRMGLRLESYTEYSYSLFIHLYRGFTSNKPMHTSR